MVNRRVLPRQRIAVIGAGAGGLAAAFLLSKRHDVTLFEATDSLGGHAHAETIETVDAGPVTVDTAFLIFNDGTYRNFLKFLDGLGVRDRAIPAEMSSCFSNPERGLDYALGNGFRPFLARPLTLLRPELAFIFRDLIAFRKRAVRDLDAGADLSGVTAGEYLSIYSQAFVDCFVWPLTAAIWSLPAKRMADYPISTLLEYFDNHQLLRGRSERRWRTFLGSSCVYTHAFATSFEGRIRLDTPIVAVQRTEAGVKIVSARRDGHESELFDAVVLATHADVSLRLLSEPNTDERRLLGAWSYQDNPVTLHSDPGVLHPDQRLWCSWNMRRENGEYRISYYLNRLQRLKTVEPLILTLGDAKLNPAKIQKSFVYRHPVFDSASVETQPALDSLNGIDRVYFCGSYFGYGFHEDAVRSGAAVARHFGIDWETPAIRLRVAK